MAKKWFLYVMFVVNWSNEKLKILIFKVIIQKKREVR